MVARVEAELSESIAIHLTGQWPPMICKVAHVNRIGSHRSNPSTYGVPTRLRRLRKCGLRPQVAVDRRGSWKRGDKAKVMSVVLLAPCRFGRVVFVHGCGLWRQSEGFFRRLSHCRAPLSLSLFNRQELESRKSSGVKSAVKLLMWPLFQSSIMTPIFGWYRSRQNLQYQRRRVALMSSCLSQASLSITCAHSSSTGSLMHTWNTDRLTALVEPHLRVGLQHYKTWTDLRLCSRRLFV